MGHRKLIKTFHLTRYPRT